MTLIPVTMGRQESAPEASEWPFRVQRGRAAADEIADFAWGESQAMVAEYSMLPVDGEREVDGGGTGRDGAGILK